MAEEVQISNVGGEGVASEVTLARLVTSIEALAKKSGIDSKSQAAKLQALYNQEVTKSNKATKQSTAETEINTTATKHATNATNNFAASIGNAVATGLGALTKSAIDLSASLWNNETGVQAFTNNLPGIGRLLSPLAKQADELIQSFRTMSQSGAAFGGSIEAMKRMSTNMGISLSEMTDLIRNSSPSLAALGGTVEQGAIRFANMNKNIKATGDFNSLMNMGFAVEEINEGMADYVSLQARMGTLQGRSTENLAAGSANYLKQIDLLARVTGKTREEAQAALDAQAADSVARTLLNQFDQNTEEGQKRFNNLTASLALLDEVGGSTAEALKGMLTGNPTGAAAELLGVLGDSGSIVLDAMKQIGEGADPAVLQQALAAAGGELEAFAGADAASRARIIQELKAQGSPLGDFLDNATVMMNLAERDLGAAAESQAAAAEARDGSTAAMLQFEEQQRLLSAKMHEIFISSGVLDLIGSSLTVFGNMLENITTYLTKFSENVASGGWFLAITTAFTDGIGSLWKNAGVVAALVAGISALFLGKAALGAMTKGIAGSVSKLFGGGGDSDSTPKSRANAGRGAGNAIGNIGKGLGQGIGGVLKGLASGLAAFANPAILIGAGILGGAIIAIGAGIAGATWLLGKALPTFAEGLKSFADIDGNNLLNVAGGIAGVGAALAVFGAGAIVGSVGAVISNILDALPGKSPLEKLKEFADADLNTQRIINNANAMVAYSNAMKGFSGGPSPKLFAAFKTGIVSLLGGETNPVAPIKAFGEVSLNTAGIIANAEAVNAYAEAMKNFPSSPSASVFTAVKDGIISLLGSSTDVLAPIKAFGDMSFNTASIIANAGAVAAYAEAMKDFPNSPAASVFTAAKNGIISLLGGDTDPFAPMKAFGDMSFNTAGIIANSESVKAFSLAMSHLASSDISSIEIPQNLESNLTALSNVSSGGLVSLANGMTAIANVTGLQNNFDILNAGFNNLDSVRSYTNAMNDLVEALEKMNEELSKDNSGFETGTNAGDVVGQTSLTTSSTSQGTQQLNTTMQQVLMILQEMRDLDIDVERNTRNIIGSNLAQGGVSNRPR